MKYTLTIITTLLMLNICMATNPIHNKDFSRSYLSLNKDKIPTKDKDIYICQLSYCSNPATGNRCQIKKKATPEMKKKDYYTSPLYFLQWMNRKKSERNFNNFRTKNNKNITYIVNRIINNTQMKIWCQQNKCLKNTITIIGYKWRNKLMKELTFSIKLKDKTSRKLELLCSPESKKNMDLSRYE